MLRHAAELGLAAAVLTNPPAAAAVDSSEAGAPDLKFSGYYKNLLINSETVFPAGERYTLDLNRLRLQLNGRVTKDVAVDVQYDNEILLGSYIRTAQFRLQKNQPSDEYWRTERNYIEGGSYYGRQRLYRGSVTFSSGETDIRIGRQRIAWGTGRFWSPLDILNPFNPIQLERDERVGVDAVLAEYKVGALSRLSAIYAPAHAPGQWSAALRWHGNAAGTDYSLVGGRFRGNQVVGLDLASQIGDAGVRAELMHVEPEAGQSYLRGVIGLDYAFASTLTLSGEVYYNGAGATRARDYDFTSLFAGKIQNVARPYFGAYAGYEITPLIKWNNYFVANLFDHSLFFSPTLTFSVKTNVDLTVGTQLFRGSSASEYGHFNGLYYLQAQWFF